ncbi:MAG: ATP-binding protein [Bacteroides sp.]|nr:ATP-binding protein [Ruminococcus flavefaciens]MCM1554047.1 ATP-binding protein [Bacteroides sp.]
MERKAIHDLINWYKAKTRKPLIVRGARQVGKTWLINHFAETLGSPFVYINFEDDKPLQDLFEADFDMQRILERISVQKDIDIKPDTLIIFDELQEAVHGITALKYFCRKTSRATGYRRRLPLGYRHASRRFVSCRESGFHGCFPYGFRRISPCHGQSPVGQNHFRKEVGFNKDRKRENHPSAPHLLLRGRHAKCVETFTLTNDYAAVRNVQRALLDSYDNDFSKHAPLNLVPRIQLVWNSVVSQLTKENKKFVYGLVREGARAREFELALEWLFDAGLLYKVSRTKKGELPLKAYEDPATFKIFLLDIGLLSAMCQLDAQAIVEQNNLIGSFKGGLAEQYVMQQLRPYKDLSIYYWSSDKSDGEIDFLLQRGNRIIPIEVKAEENLKAKSLRLFSLY